MNYKNTYKDFNLLWLKRLNISKEALEIYCNCGDIIDAHTETYIWKKLINYDLTKGHNKNIIPVINQFDYIKSIKANMSGIVMDISANPFRFRNRFITLRETINLVIKDINFLNENFLFVRNYNDYLKAKNQNKIALWLSIQGGNALSSPEELDFIPEIHRITLVHLTNNKIAKSSTSLSKKNSLSEYGKKYIEKMIDNKILIDLAHINRNAFFEIDNYLPKENTLIVSHTGINGIRNSFRNLDDEQIKIIARRNGFIGIIYEKNFLSYNPFKCSIDDIIKHIEYVINLIGDDFVGLGSDYDGMISLPKDFKDITYQPILVEKMLKRNWSIDRIEKILGKNFLRVIREFN